MRYSLLILATLLCCFSCKKEVAVAEIGNQAPAYTFTNILNSNSSTITLKDLKGKTVILEFWATWCGPCIPAMRKLDSLQKEFKDDLEIITISGEGKERLERFIKTTNTSLRVVSDTTHSNSFKYKVIPHSVILDKNGIVRAITSPENITSSVIKTLITANSIDLPIKDDFYIDPNLKVETLATIDNSDYRLMLKGYDQEKRSSTKPLTSIDGNRNGIEINNLTIPSIYQALYNVASPLRIIYADGLSDSDFPFENDHRFSFTIEVSEAFEDKWSETATSFLNNHFNTNGRMTTVNKDVYVLTKTSDVIKPSEAEKTEFMFMGPILNTKKIKMNRLVSYLENFTDLPVEDQTNLNDAYDISLNWQEEDPKTIHTELAKYGLKLGRSETPLPIKVLEIFKKKE